MEKKTLMADAPVVFWRPGCSFCDRLFRALDKAEVAVERRNIWDDDDARTFVRAHNRGNETVPTVIFDGIVRTNPRPADLIAEVRAASHTTPKGNSR